MVDTATSRQGDGSSRPRVSCRPRHPPADTVAGPTFLRTSGRPQDPARESQVNDDWLDEDHDRPRSRRRTGLALLAAVPWLVVAGLLVVPQLTADPDTTPEHDEAAPSHPPDAPAPSEPAGDPADEAPDPADEADPPTEPDADAPPSGDLDAQPDASDRDTDDPSTSPGAPSTDDPVLALEELRGRWRVEPGLEEAASLAVMVARAALTGLDPPLAIEGVTAAADGSYAEHLTVEAVEHTSASAATVTILALVLEDDGQLAASVRRLAVPIAMDTDGPRPAGPPWELPPPDLDAVEPDVATVDDADLHLAAAEALADAGLPDVEVVRLATAEGWPMVAHVRDPEGDADATVWLRRHLDGFVVAGTPLPDGDEDREPEAAP